MADLTLDYNDVLESAFANLLKEYCDGKICFRSERDLQANLFFECRRIMEERHFPQPLELYTEKTVFNKYAKVDLVLGDNKVLVELKLEPIYPGVPTPVIFTRKSEWPTSIEGDLEKIKDYARRGLHAHFIVFDEEGSQARKMREKPWVSAHVKLGDQERVVYYLHVKYSGSGYSGLSSL